MVGRLTFLHDHHYTSIWSWSLEQLSIKPVLHQRKLSAQLICNYSKKTFFFLRIQQCHKVANNTLSVFYMFFSNKIYEFYC